MHVRGEKVVQGFGGKPEGRRTLRRLKHRWEDGIRLDLKETGWEDVEWFQLAQDRGWWQAVVNAVMRGMWHTWERRVNCTGFCWERTNPHDQSNDFHSMNSSTV
jgi:hypothetical protein